MREYNASITEEDIAFLSDKAFLAMGLDGIPQIEKIFDSDVLGRLFDCTVYAFCIANSGVKDCQKMAQSVVFSFMPFKRSEEILVRNLQLFICEVQVALFDELQALREEARRYGASSTFPLIGVSGLLQGGAIDSTSSFNFPLIGVSELFENRAKPSDAQAVAKALLIMNKAVGVLHGYKNDLEVGVVGQACEGVVCFPSARARRAGVATDGPSQG